MRVALFADGSRGDVHPVLDLAQALVTHGHGVALGIPPDFVDEARARGLDATAVGLDVKAILRQEADAITSGGLRTLRVAREWLGSSFAQQFEALPRLVEGSDLVVAGGVAAAAASAAEVHRVPYRYLVYCPALLPSVEHAPPLIPITTNRRWLNRLLWPACRAISNAFLRRPINRGRRSLGLPPVGDLFEHLLGECTIVASERALAPVPSDFRGHARQVGCLHTPDPAPLPEKLDAFLRAGPAPVYLGFGSMTDPDPAATTRSFVRAAELAGCRAVISAGWAGFGDTALPESVHVAPTCSHPELFPRCSAIVHHGGAGTTTAAARAGVPQIVVPHVADQFYWGTRVTHLGLGPPQLPRRRLAAEPLAALLRETVENELLAERADDLASRLAESRPLARDPITYLA